MIRDDNTVQSLPAGGCDQRRRLGEGIPRNDGMAVKFDPQERHFGIVTAFRLAHHPVLI